MDTTLYLVVLRQPNPDIWKRIKEEWPEHHFILDTRSAYIALESVLLTDDLAEKIGMNEKEKVAGVVVEIAEINGWISKKLWEWIRKVQS